MKKRIKEAGFGKVDGYNLFCEKLVSVGLK
jgi:hypothetical protein